MIEFKFKLYKEKRKTTRYRSFNENQKTRGYFINLYDIELSLQNGTYR